MEITFEFATQDDCLDKMVPSDLRCVAAERDHAIKERNALSAQADALRVALSNLRDIAARCDRWEYFPQTALDDASDALSATPQHHLRQRDAAAGRAGFIAGYMLCNDDSSLIKHNYEGFANQYHASILAGKE